MIICMPGFAGFQECLWKLFVLWVLTAICVILIVMAFRAERDHLARLKNDILSNLQARGATNIQVKTSSSRYSIRFYLTYTLPDEQIWSQDCMVSLPDSKLFWSEPELFTQDQSKPLYGDETKTLRSNSGLELPTYQIIQVLTVPGSQDMIYLLDYTRPFANILRCQSDGSLVWQAELPPNSPDDVYTSLTLEGDRLHVYTRSCMNLVLDLHTGKIKE